MSPHPKQRTSARGESCGTCCRRSVGGVFPAERVTEEEGEGAKAARHALGAPELVLGTRGGLTFDRGRKIMFWVSDNFILSLQ